MVYRHIPPWIPSRQQGLRDPQALSEERCAAGAQALRRLRVRVRALVAAGPYHRGTYLQGFGDRVESASPIDLEARMLYPRGKHITVVVTLPSGEQVKGPLAHADDFVIALRDDSGWYRSFLRDRVKVELQDPLAVHRELLDKLTQANVHNLFAYLESLK